MRELILIISYIICAFIPLLMSRRIRTGFTIGQFWGAWFISLIGAFAGALVGTLLLTRSGIDFGFYASILPALLGSWGFCTLYMLLRGMPGNW